MTYDPAICTHSLKGNFPYREIPRSVAERTINRYKARIREQFARLAKRWTADLNSEWTIRLYLSGKLMLASALLLASAKYARNRDLMVAVPYLTYYGLFTAGRANILTLPTQKWRDSALYTLSHEKVTNVLTDGLSSLDPKIAGQVNRTLVAARTSRELFSYRFPAQGPAALPLTRRVNMLRAVRITTILCELAQLHSEALDASLQKHDTAKVGYSPEVLRQAMIHAGRNGYTLIDKEDNYRIGQLVRNEARPRHLWGYIREGFVEDFLGAWLEHKRPRTGDFDGGDTRSIVYPFP
jgi:hypothetical protein